MKKTIGLFVFLVLLGMQICFAQTRQVTGTVIDKNDRSPLPGVSVMVKGTSSGTATDINGKFTLRVSDNDVLVASFIGMKTLEVPVKGQTNIAIELESDSKALEEVMVVAYGTAKKESFTGSAEVISSEKLSERSVSSVTKALDGQVAGVQATSGSGQPGSGASIMIRGFGSINASNSPLYVVDGVPYDGNISAINPNDIESLTILKDASAGALYGSRGANGVVMITTKQNKNRQEKINVNFKAVFGINTRAIPRYETLNEREYMETMYNAYKNDLVYTQGVNPSVASTQAVTNMAAGLFGDNQKYNPYSVNTSELINTTTGKLNSDAQLKYSEDWMDEITAKNPIRQEYQLSLDGGSDKTKYMASFGYLSEDGLLKTTSFERFTGRLNLDLKPKEWLNIGLGANYSRNNSNYMGSTGTGMSNVWYSAQLIAPIYPIFQKNADGSNLLDNQNKKMYDYGSSRPGGAQSNFNSVATLYDDRYSEYSDNLSGRGFLELSKWNFKFRTNMGVDNVNFYRSVYYNPYFGNAAGSAGRLTKSNSRTFSYTFNQLLSYENKFGRHGFDVMVGHEFYNYRGNGLSGQKTGFPFGGLYELAAASTVVSASSSENNYAIQSVLSRLNYNFDEKYYLSGSFRTDGSSRFAKDSRWGNFWSAGASWRVSKEEFMDVTADWLDNLTLKASYGVQGNDQILDSDGYQVYYAWQSFYSLGWPNASMNGALLSSLENKNLKWEKNSNLNIGTEFRILDRVSGTIEWYRRKTDDMLLVYPMATSLGFDGFNTNIGSMVNSGWDISLKGDIFRTDDFSWSMTLMGSIIKNEVKKLADRPEIINGSYIIKEGETLNSFYMAKSAGVDPTSGEKLYWAFEKDAKGKKITGSEYITNDKTMAEQSKEIVGSRIPDLYGSIANEFRFKGFDLSILMTYSIGGKVNDGLYNTMMSPLFVGQTYHKNILRAWQKPGDVTDIPRVTTNATYASTNDQLVDASYLSFKNVSLGYTFDKSLMNRFGVGSLRLYATVDNLHVFTHLKGMDPQYNFSGGVGYSYTPNRTFSLGLDLRF